MIALKLEISFKFS